MPLPRRSFLKGAAVASGAVLLGQHGTGEAAAKPFVNYGPIAREKRARIAGRSPVEHVVVVMMENRSFDHFMGWLPGANGIGIDPDGKV
ncbi:MAG: alkaline phosphatase family protein, partial [Mycobacteriales bacterium]